MKFTNLIKACTMSVVKWVSLGITPDCVNPNATHFTYILTFKNQHELMSIELRVILYVINRLARLEVF